MHGSDEMNRDELLELAPLDALGLLDEVEAAMFHRAFHQASPSVQAEVIELQAHFATSDHFLAGEEPRPILRRKVLLSLEEAFDESAENLRPIAQIGVQVGAPMGGRAAVLPPAVQDRDPPSDVRDPDQIAAFRALMEEFAERNARAAARTTPFWRAAAIVLAAGLVVSLYVLRQTSENAGKIYELVISQGIEQQIGELVPSLPAYSSPGDRTYAMEPVSPKDAGLASAVVFVDSARGQVVVTAFGLGRFAPDSYSLRAVDRDGNSHEVARLEGDRFLAGAVGTFAMDFRPVRFELVGPNGVAFAADASGGAAIES